MSRTSKLTLGWMIVSIVLACGMAAAVYFQREASMLERERAAMLAALGEEYDAVIQLMNGTDYGFAILDSEERVVKWNAALERWTGYTHEEMVGERISHLMTGEVAERHHEAFMQAMGDPSSAGKTHVVDCRLITKSGGGIPVKVSSRVVHPDDGRSPYAVASIDQQSQVVEVKEPH